LSKFSLKVKEKFETLTKDLESLKKNLGEQKRENKPTTSVIDDDPEDIFETNNQEERDRQEEKIKKQPVADLRMQPEQEKVKQNEIIRKQQPESVTVKKINSSKKSTRRSR